MEDARPDDSTATYPGQRLGLPHGGPGSVATWVRRGAALAIDWAASMLVAALFAGDAILGSGPEAWLPLGVFFLEASVLTALVGASFGQVALRVAVVRLDGKPVDLARALLRTGLICLVVPPLVFNRDNRGLHDLAAGTVTIRR